MLAYTYIQNERRWGDVLVNSETITLKEEIEQIIRESRQYVFQIDHEAIMNGIKKGTDFIDFDEFRPKGVKEWKKFKRKKSL